MDISIPLVIFKYQRTTNLLTNLHTEKNTMTTKQIRETLRSAAMRGISEYSHTMGGANLRVQLLESRRVRVDDGKRLVHFEIIVKEVKG